MGGRPVDLAGLGWSTGSGSRRCGEEQSRGRHGREDGAARWGRDVSEEKAGARGERVAHAGPLRAGGAECVRVEAGPCGLGAGLLCPRAGLREEWVWAVGLGWGFGFSFPFYFFPLFYS